MVVRGDHHHLFRQDGAVSDPLTRRNAPRPLPAWLLVASENSPSKVAAAEKPLRHFTSVATVVSALSAACAAPSLRRSTAAAFNL
jgi:hypothetical protein